MPIDLKKVTTKYDGHNCSNKSCNKPLKIGDTIYFNPANKEVFCEDCGKKMINGESNVPDDISIRALVADLSLKVDHLNTVLSVVLAHLGTIEGYTKILKQPEPKVDKKKKS